MRIIPFIWAELYSGLCDDNIDNIKHFIMYKRILPYDLDQQEHFQCLVDEQRIA